jgi:hypothetical protein
LTEASPISCTGMARLVWHGSFMNGKVGTSG